MERRKSSRRTSSSSSAAKGVPFSDDPLWYKDAVIYQVHVKSFFDSNNDGIGDFAGLINKLDYIADLGVNTIWLLPFYPSPRRDDGYDIADYRGVHPDYGTMADARRFIAEAHRRGLRVIIELVINHTSDQHPWFQRARRAKPGSAARDFYVWSDNDQAYSDTRIIFCDTEKSNWTWDPVANAFFWHRFYSHQPDLNFDNPRVLEAVLSVMAFWLDMNVDGLRLDAVPYLIEREGTSNENLPETHAILKRIRAELDRDYPGRMLLAEANMWPEDVLPYFGDNDECHMAFHFPLMPRMYMALAQEDRFPIVDILRQTPEIPSNCQWAIFLRNHDELTLEMVTDRERDYLWNHYAAEKRARINLGIRRRLLPLLERDRRRAELLNSLMLSMPGTPVIYYGDEIGMGDNIHLGDRDGVRTPMQWTPDRNGGFSRSDPAKLVLPPIMDPLYGYDAVNVEAQMGDPYSQLNWMRRMLTVRKQHYAFSRGSLSVLYPTNRRILAYLREFADGGDGDLMETILCVANVSRSAQAVELDLSHHAGRVPLEMLGGSAFPPIGKLPYLLTLPPYGFYWFLLASESRMPAWHVPAPEPLPELATLVLRQGIAEILETPRRMILENEALTAYLPKRRWYAAKQEKLRSARIAIAVLLPVPQAYANTMPTMLTEIEAVTSAGTERYQLPLGYVREEDVTTALPHQLALARVRRGRHTGFLTDAFALDVFAETVVESMRSRTSIATDDGEVKFMPTPALDEIEVGAEASVRRLSAEQTNSSLILQDRMVIKVLRRLLPGVHPEAEMGRHLTALGYANAPRMLGEVTRIDREGVRHTMIMLQQYIHNQGDAWQWSLDTLALWVQQTTVSGAAMATDAAAGISHPERDLAQLSIMLGKRLGELHAALAAPADNPAFAPEVASEVDTRAWAAGARAQVEAALEVVRVNTAWSGEAEVRRAAHLIGQREQLLAKLDALAAAGVGTLRTRIHGDFHLGQVLVGNGDVYIVDFEGEPAKSLEQRRAKSSPLRDVAGLLRSFDYAAGFASRNGPADLDEAAELRKQQILRSFAPNCQDAFLQAYREAAFAGPLQMPPETERALLQLFSLEKAGYEVCYEAAHRPAWIPVPMNGLAKIVDELLSMPQGENAHE
ncbi:maltose alpha-D-glucosyltransferase [Janthinobacterium sp. 17J80-10]|uniref:maltose alpha-D-glucosyltransferase n=1 Tax=Janthinobacterium sp. 17J80-10 TaxID=2497863 RepID=UPI0010059B24|nr:maltose alpha-D-glucosyltransferase [Janthinobacterium sp. 17J80-10]QAU34495.1 maltose alpha-D-glucosyltransferase [Janthinobacterium sp. 17J80-10]